MKNNFKNLLAFLTIILVLAGCSKNNDYSLGDLSTPTNIVINTNIVGQDAAHPNGDGSGDVIISITSDNGFIYKIDYDANTPTDLVLVPGGTITKKYTTEGTNTYNLTVIAYGKGGTSSIATKAITVRSDFNAAPEIIQNLTGGTSKSWVVDKSIQGHFGVGPWDVLSIRPEWWAAAVNEKVACCNCFYTATFKFTKVSSTNYTLQVTSPDGAFTKTGALTSLPGIPAAGDEGCYSYAGATSSFSFVPASSGAPATPSSPNNSGSTMTSIQLAGNATYIGYGALQKEYEILAITSTSMYLRVRGTETGNAWYIKLKSI